MKLNLVKFKAAPERKHCVRWSAMIKVQYTLNCLHLWRVAVFYACVLLFEGLTEFCLFFGLALWHFAGFANREIALLLTLRRCMKSFSAFL